MCHFYNSNDDKHFQPVTNLPKILISNGRLIHLHTFEFAPLLLPNFCFISSIDSFNEFQTVTHICHFSKWLVQFEKFAENPHVPTAHSITTTFCSVMGGHDWNTVITDRSYSLKVKSAYTFLNYATTISALSLKLSLLPQRDILRTIRTH